MSSLGQQLFAQLMAKGQPPSPRAAPLPGMPGMPAQAPTSPAPMQRPAGPAAGPQPFDFMGALGRLIGPRPAAPPMAPQPMKQGIVPGQRPPFQPLV